MVEKKFYLESKGDSQRIGLRAQIVSFLIQQDLKRGNVLNDLSNKKNVIVAVSFESKPPGNAEVETSEIEKIKEELVKYLNSLASSDPECYGQIPQDIVATELKDLSNPHAVGLLDLQTLSSALMLEQTSKGVGAMLSLKIELKPLADLKQVLAIELKPLADLKQVLAPLQTLPEILERLRKADK